MNSIKFKWNGYFWLGCVLQREDISKFLIEQSARKLKTTGDIAFFGSVLPGQHVEGYTQSCMWGRKDAAIFTFLKIGQTILNWPTSQTNDAGKWHWLDVLLHLWTAVCKIKIFLNDPSQLGRDYAAWRPNQIFRLNVSWEVCFRNALMLSLNSNWQLEGSVIKIMF